MSTISTQVNWGASYLVRDVYQRFIAPDASQKQLVGVSRWASALVLILGICATLFLENVSIERVWSLLMALGAGTGAVFMLRWFWRRINAWTEIAAMVASLVLFCLIGVEKTPRLWSQIVVAPTEQMRILWSAVSTIAIWLVVMFATEPEKESVLVGFYRKVLPAGPGWRHIPELAGVRSTDQLLRPLLAAFASSLFIYSILSLVGGLIFGDWGTTAISAGLATLFAALAAWLLAGVFRAAPAQLPKR